MSIKPRDLPESRMFAPVRDWLAAQGYKVWAEIWGHDVVALKGDHLVIVELKTSMTRRLLSQASTATVYADVAYAAVPSMPRKASLARCEKQSFGVLLVNGAVTVIKEPTKAAWEPQRRRMVDRLSRHEPDDRIGGVPNMAGDGDAQRCLKLVDAYLVEHPDATWREIFREVPNHYAHHRSMSQGIGAARERVAMRVRRSPAAAPAAALALGLLASGCGRGAE